eukprot:5682977-Pleurochrysis_carterae.AAC.1
MCEYVHRLGSSSPHPRLSTHRAGRRVEVLPHIMIEKVEIRHYNVAPALLGGARAEVLYVRNAVGRL